MRSAVGLWKWKIIAVTAAAVMAAVFAVSASAATQTKVALIIGNGAYKGVPELTNPTNDATAVAGAFLRLGFSVRLVTDASYDDMRRALLEFSRKARDSEMAVVFYAGHGIELGGENWLIPVDAELKTDLDTEQEAISLRSVMLMVSAASKLGLVVLDACRDNPFTNRIRRSIATRGVTRGLGRVEPINNVLVAYAAKDGTTAFDGSGDHSPFTAALLKHIEMPGLEVTFLFRNVRDDVIAATGNEQQPFVYGSLSKEAIYFKPPPAVADPAAPDQITWSLIKDTTDETALKRFTTQYPKSDLRQDAEARIAALEAAQAAKPVPPKPDEVTWALLKETTDEAALKQFTSQYPNSALRKDAEARIAALEAAQAAKPVPPKPDEVTWSLIKETTDEGALRRFTAQYPNSALRKDADARIAAIEAAPKAAPSSAADPHELARSLQFELRRVGCFDGAVNGEFDNATRAAWHNFAKHASLKIPDDLSSDAIKTVRSIDKRICPLICPNGQRAEGERCVATGPSAARQPNGRSDTKGREMVPRKAADGTVRMVPKGRNFAECARNARNLGHGSAVISQVCGPSGYIGPQP